MTKTEFVNSVSRAVHKVGFTVRKHSPEILLAAGTVGIVASTVMACKATTKTGAILEKAKEQVNGVHQVLENEELNKMYAEEYGMEFTAEEAKKELAVVYLQTAVDFVKLYGPSVLLGAASLTCILASHNIIRKRNVALTAAYATLDQSFKGYRGRVIEHFGKELDRELKYNIKSKEIEEKVTDENGEETVVKKTVEYADLPIENGLDCSEYARFFDEYCIGCWQKDTEYNLMFLRNQQRYANELLRTKGTVFLNEVYEMLGIPRTKAGQIVGWVYDKNAPIGDNYIDFGIYDPRDPNKRAFVNGLERSILLDFNVDGPVWDYVH